MDRVREGKRVKASTETTENQQPLQWVQPGHQTHGRGREAGARRALIGQHGRTRATTKMAPKDSVFRHKKKRKPQKSEEKDGELGK